MTGNGLVLAERIMSERLSTPIGNFVHAVEVPAGCATLFLSGMTSRGEGGEVLFPGNAGEQTRRILENTTVLLAERGLDLSHVVKVTVYVRDMADLDAVHEVRREFFVDAMPTSTLIEVSRFVDREMLVEIDSTAYVPVLG